MNKLQIATFVIVKCKIQVMEIPSYNWSYIFQLDAWLTHICGGESERQRGQVKQTFHMPCPGICKWGDLLAKKKKWRSWVFYSMKPCETIQRASHLYSFSIDFSCAKPFNSLPGVSIFFAISWGRQMLDVALLKQY